MNLYEVIEKFNLIHSTTISDNQFNFLGIIEFSNENEKYSFNAFIRKNTIENTTWIEVLMYDITLSKRIEHIDETIKLKEKVLSKTFVVVYFVL